MIAALALAAALGTTAPADIGFVFRGTAGAAPLIAACPRVMVVDTSAGRGDLLTSFFSACPHGTAALQLPSATFAPTILSAANAQLDAARYWSIMSPSWIAPLQLAPGTRANTWLVGPGDFQTFPSWRSDPTCDVSGTFCSADFMGAFWAELDRLARADGWRGLMLPPFAPLPGDRADAFCRLLAGVDLARVSDIAWMWDGLSPAMAMSATDEATTTFGFRGLRTTCPAALAHPVLVRVTVAGGWQTRTDATGLLTWLQWLDGAVASDVDPFLGVAVVGFGTGDLNDLTPAVSQLAAFLTTGGTPSGGGGGSNSGSGGPTTPPTAPGSNLGPDRGHSGGCSTGGSMAMLGWLGGALALIRRPTRRRD